MADGVGEGECWRSSSETSTEERSQSTETQEALDRVRFDTHISFLESGTAKPEEERGRLSLKKELEPETLREETAEELALVVSPLTHRAPSPLPLPSSPPVRTAPFTLSPLSTPLHQISGSDKLSPASPSDASPLLP